MTLAMIFPSEDSEKAISNYSSRLSDSLKKEIEVENINYIAGKPSEVFKITRKLRESNFDNIHFQHEYNIIGGFSIPIFILYLWLGIFSTEYIFTTMHTVLSKKEKFNSGKVKTFLRKVLYNLQNKFIGFISDKIIVHAEFFKDILVNEYGLNENKIEVIPQGIIEDIPKYNKEKLKKEVGIKGNVYLIIGSLVPDHGADIILKQANKIGKTILVVGSDKAINDRNDERITNWSNYLIKIVDENYFEEYVKFGIGKIPYSLWWKYFTIADLVLLPYKGGIGSGIFSDAIATRTPMIGSNIKYFKEYSKYNFIKIAEKDEDFPNKIKEAMIPKNYKKMKDSFDSYIKEYGLSNISKKYINLYEDVRL